MKMKPQWSFSSTEKNKNKTKNLPINTGIKTSNLCRTEKGNIKYILKKTTTLNWNYEKHKMSDFYHVLNMRSDFLFLITSFCLALFYCKGLMPPHWWNRRWKAVSTMCREFHFLLKVGFFFQACADGSNSGLLMFNWTFSFKEVILCFSWVYFTYYFCMYRMVQG